MSWNKGGSFLENAMDPIKQTATEYKPDVLTITVAQLRPETPIQLVNIPGYKLNTDSLYTNSLSARTISYTIDRLATKGITLS